MMTDQSVEPLVDHWIETEMWNFVHGAAMNLGLPTLVEAQLHREMQIVLKAHSIYRESLAKHAPAPPRPVKADTLCGIYCAGRADLGMKELGHVNNWEAWQRVADYINQAASPQPKRKIYKYPETPKVCPECDGDIFISSGADNLTCYICCLLEKIDELEAASPQPESAWISVEERLPEIVRTWKDGSATYTESEEILLFDTSWGRRTGYYHPSSKTWAAKGGDSMHYVTHWQPLPAPPAEKGKKL